MTKNKTRTTKRSAAKSSRDVSRVAEAPAAADRDDVLTLAEAAAYLRVSSEEVVHAVGPSGLPGRRIGGEWRFLRSALQAWLATPPAPSSNESLAALAGAWKDDPFLDDLRQQLHAGRECVDADDGYVDFGRTGSVT